VKKASRVGGPLWALDDKAQTVRTRKTKQQVKRHMARPSLKGDDDTKWNA
jgi:hypothetical protein